MAKRKYSIIFGAVLLCAVVAGIFFGFRNRSNVDSGDAADARAELDRFTAVYTATEAELRGARQATTTLGDIITRERKRLELSSRAVRDIRNVAKSSAGLLIEAERELERALSINRELRNELALVEAGTAEGTATQ